MTTSNQRKYGVQCNGCERVIISTATHDCYYCHCGATFIDGGDDYSRIGFKEKGYTDVILDMINQEVYTIFGRRISWDLFYHAMYPLPGGQPGIIVKSGRNRKLSESSLWDRWPY